MDSSLEVELNNLNYERERRMSLLSESRKHATGTAGVDFDLDDGLVDTVRTMYETKAMGLLQMMALGAFWWGTSLWLFLAGVLLVPEEVQKQASNKRGSTLGVILLFSSLVTVVATPLFGSMSDSSYTRFGRRMPWLMGGIASAFVASLFLAAVQDSLALYSLVFCLISLCLAAAMAPFNGLVADVVHPSQRGTVSGVIGFCVSFGSFSGAVIALAFEVVGLAVFVLLIFICMALATIVTVYFIKEPPRNPMARKAVHHSSRKEQLMQYAEPFRHPGFRWVFITRLMVQFGIFTVQEFLLFYLKEAVDLPQGMSPERALSISMMGLLFMALISPIAAGWLSDRLGGRRKILVYIAGGTMAGVALLLAFNRAWWPVPVCASAFGVGFGAFNAVDFAMALDVLPNEETAARDLGLWHLAMVLPMCVAPQVAGVILDLANEIEHNAGYTVLFLLAGLYMAAGIAAIRKVPGVK